MANKKQALHYVEERLLILKSIKNKDGLVDNLPKYRNSAKVKRNYAKSEDKSDFATNVWFSVKTAKDAELLAGMQEYNFIPLSNEARRKIELLKVVWKYWWLVSKTDKRLSRVIPESTTTWTWWMYEGLKTIKRKIKTPSRDEEGNISFTEEVKIDYDWIWCEFIPLENFFIDGTDIENSNEAIWVKFWDREQWINEHELANWYHSVNDVPKWKEYTFVWDNDTDPKQWQDDENIITEMTYYNKSKDEMIVLANGKEVYSSCIPFIHKELPFCPFYDYQIEGRIMGMGEFELLDEDIAYKDAIRSLSIDVIKAQMWVMAINDDVDFDETTFEYWPFAYMKLDDIAGLKHVSPTISTNSIDAAEIKVDNDIISKTGIDYKAQLLWPNETATKTAAKSQSSKKRINLNLKINGYSFFERLARLRLSNMRLLHSHKTMEIPVEGWSIMENGDFEPINWWYGSFTVKPDTIIDNYNIVPITESILWVTEEREKKRAMETVQLLSWLIKSDGTPAYPWENLWRYIAERLGVDNDELSGKTWVDAEKIIAEIDNAGRWVSTSASDPTSPNFIPPEQRSWANQWVKLSGTDTVSDADVLG